MAIKRKIMFLTIGVILAAATAAAVYISPWWGAWGEPPTPVYVTIVVHNEEATHATTYQDYRENLEYYLNHREMLRKFALMLHTHGVRFNFQSDWTFLVACGMYENAEVRSNTEGKNIVRYLKEELGVEVDPHAHETQYNYADVAYLIENLGVAPSHTVGGFISDPPERSVFEHFLSPIRGAHYDYTWTPEILWGGATYLHENDVAVSGVWRPKDTYSFYQHEENGKLVYVGRYTAEFSGVTELVSKLEGRTIPSGKIYTATIFVSQAVLSEPYINKFEQWVLQLKELESQGKVVLTTIQETVEAWEKNYSAQPNIYFKEGRSPEELGLISVPPLEYDEVTYQRDIRVPSAVAGKEGLVVRLLYPKTCTLSRFENRSPIVVSVPGADYKGSVETGSPADTLLTGFGMTYVYFNFPGGGVPPYQSGGMYDSRGPLCQAALRDVILFALGKKADNNGKLITDLIPYADTTNVGVVGWSNGGNITGVVFDLYGGELSGVRYYVGYENPAGDEYVLVDLGGGLQPNPAYIRGKTYLDSERGSVSSLDPTFLTYEPASQKMFFDFDNDGVLDSGTDYTCGSWYYNGYRYFSTEITEYALSNGIALSLNVAIGEKLESFWENRDMSRHFDTMNLPTLKGALIFASENDHVQNTPDYPHVVVNYQGWSQVVPFVRLNPDASYVGPVFERGGVDVTGTAFTDTDANTLITLGNVENFLEPEIGLQEADSNYITAGVLEMADRVHFDNWDVNLGTMLVSIE